MIAVVMVAESRTTATRTTVAIMTLELELEVATSSEKTEGIIDIYLKAYLNTHHCLLKKKQKEIDVKIM